MKGRETIAFGIDFGTANTAVAECHIQNGISVIQHGEVDEPYPALAALHKEKAPLFGMEVKKRRSQLQEEGYTVISSLKPLLGTGRVIQAGSRSYTAVGIAEMYLKYVRQKVEEKSGKRLTEAAAAIPANFQPEQRRALREAAGRAGIKILSFISEAAAAYLSNWERASGVRKAAVFDWGGETIDVSILSIEGREIQELASSSRRLGGRDIDELVARHLHREIMREARIPKAYEEMSGQEREQILERSEEAKKRLSAEESASVCLKKYGEKAVIRQSITLDEFRELPAGRIEEAVRVLHQAVQRADISLGQLDAIVMTGGSSGMQPVVQRFETIGGAYHIPVIRSEKMQWAAASGAATLASRRPTCHLRTELGVLLSDGSVYPIFEAGQRIPCESPPLSFGVVEDTTNAVFILVDGSRRELKRMAVPVKGFTAEGIRLKAAIGEDLAAHIELRSTHAENMGQEAYIDGLAFSYCMD